MKKLCSVIMVFLTLLTLVSCKDNSKSIPPNSSAGTEQKPPVSDEPIPADPEVPDTPDDPVLPNTPDDPNTPETPVDPDTPDTPVTPPVTPEDPIEPDTPIIPDPPKGNMNPLTGLYDGISDTALNRKPVAIMLGNSVAALPHWGVSQADIIYEMIAEGRITRLMAIFQDPSKIDKIASIRSARPYFIDIAQSYGAVFMHFGGSVPAYEQIEARTDLIDIDGIKYQWENVVFFRDEWRRKELGREHSVYTSGELIELALSKQKKPIEQADHPSAFKFNEQSSADGGTPMSRVQITFQSKHKPYYVYDNNTGKYLRYQYNDPHIDGLNNEQIAVTNLLILRMPLHDVGDDLNLVEIQTTGTGTGYYFCGGKYVEITWKKDSYNSPITYYTLDGNELVCKPGQTFVSVVTLSGSVDIE